MQTALRSGRSSRTCPLWRTRGGRGERRCLSFYDTRFTKLAQQSVHKVNFDSLVDFATRNTLDEATLIKSARYLQVGIPIRLARRIVDIHQLPYICGINPYMQQVHDHYVDICNQMLAFPEVKTLEDNRAWNEIVKASLDTSRQVLPKLAKASKEISPHLPKNQLKTFLDKFLTSRIARRVLAEQHLALSQQFHTGGTGLEVGVISMDCDAAAICRRSFDVAAKVARASYGIVPKLVIHATQNCKFSYIERHVEYMLLEILKNAVRATVEYALKTRVDDVGGVLLDDDLPPVRVYVYCSPYQTIFRVSDQGGGISSEVEKRIFDYAFSTVNDDALAMQAALSQSGGMMDISMRPMAGEGFGLPMARCYATYFGGDLNVQTMQGHGTEVYLRLRHLNREQYVAKLNGDLGAD